MATPRFLVAKYVRDMARMEPRNIGIVLWADGIVVTKFIGDVVDSDASPLPKFMARKNHRVYKRWVKYWCDAIQKEHIVGANGESVGRDDPRFLDAFSLRESRDNYILTMGGSVPVSADKLRVQETLNYLFHAFIDDGSSAELTEAKNPKEHYEMLQLEKQREWQRQMAEDERTWRKNQAERERQWRKEDIDLAKQSMRSSVWTQLAVAAIGVAAGLAAAGFGFWLAN